MGYNLRRTTDGVGDAGARSDSISPKGEVVGHEPTIGCAILVGSITAGTYSRQDWWMTTIITGILEEIKNDDTHYVRFKTGNSEYEWWGGKYPKEIDNDKS